MAAREMSTAPSCSIGCGRTWGALLGSRASEVARAFLAVQGIRRRRRPARGGPPGWSPQDGLDQLVDHVAERVDAVGLREVPVRARLLRDGGQLLVGAGAEEHDR